MWHKQRMMTIHPIDIARDYAMQDFALLRFAPARENTGKPWLLAHSPQQLLAGNHFSFPEHPALNPSCLWAGYFGYELRHDLEISPRDRPGMFDLPAQYLRCFSQQQTFAESHIAPSRRLPLISSLQSNFTKARYFQAVEQLREYICAGDIYQANLTRKFYGTFERAPDPIDVFTQLYAANPAPYSALMKCGDVWIISSSPECFLRVDTSGNACSQPIKGSIRRGEHAQNDAALAQSLLNSEKNRAENLMIVDLVRHDFSRVCMPASVHVPSQNSLLTLANVHHLVSTVEGTIAPPHTHADLLRACFPPGSMTGAPKLRAMQRCSEFERVARGVYSGALGWLQPDGAMEFSVVIRTILLRDNQFEFQVGGGIVADSTPENEWEETIAKSASIAYALNITLEQLHSL